MRVLPFVLAALASGIASVSAQQVDPSSSSSSSSSASAFARDIASDSSASSSSHLTSRNEQVHGLLHLNRRGRRLDDAGTLVKKSHKTRRSRKNRKRSGSCAAKTTTSSTAKTTSKTSTSSSTKATSTTKTTSSSSSSTKTSTSTSATATATTSSSMIMGGYWPYWVNDTLPATSISWAKFDYVAFAFAVPSTTGTIPIDSYTESLMKSLITAGHAKGKKVIVSLGGWDQSNGFSPSVSTDALQSTFASNILAFIKKYGLDGVDLDWEYPNSSDAGNYDSADAKNWQTFLGVLRTTLGTSYLITTATSLSPWIGSNGSPVGSVARAAAALDYIMMMNYDVWQTSSTPGSNAPLADLCGNSSQPGANAAAAVKSWGDAGMPRSKMLLGVPYYGYVSNSAQLVLHDRRSLIEQFQDMRRAAEDSESDESLSKRTVTLTEGSINFDDIVADGVLSRSSATSYVAKSSGGFTRYWDSCSDTPYLANGKQVITYDDPTSLYDKAAFAAEAGLGGCAAWSLDGDVSTWDLTAAMLSGMGKS